MKVLKKYKFKDVDGQALEANPTYIKLVADFIYLMDKLKPLAESKGREKIVNEIERMEFDYEIEVDT